jgi:hypothetical protein
MAKNIEKGIYTVANDNVYDQFVALLNSIERNCGQKIPVCVIPYDDNIVKVKKEILKRKNIFLFTDNNILKKWEDFSLKIWKTHPTALEMWKKQGITGVRRLGMNRRYCAFDSKAPFKKFIYFDADILAFQIDNIFKSLEKHKFVVYDFQFKDPSHIFDVKSQNLNNVFSKKRIESEIFCAGFFASHRGLLDSKARKKVISKLAKGESNILYTGACNQSVLNYMIMSSRIPVYNIALNLPKQKVTGNSVTSSHFQDKNHTLYDKGNRLTYLHYIGVPTDLISKACQGENIDFPYRDTFLYYRFMKEPDKMPKFEGKPKPYGQKSLKEQVIDKLRQIRNRIL